jgi:molybdopterin molybdotransferase
VPPLLTIDEALELILAEARPLGAEPVALGDARGRYLAEDVAAQVDLPPFPSSAMDGFAVRSADTPGSLPVVFRIAAGRPADRALAAGEAIGIATGGVVPEGADAVVPIEYVVDHDNSVEIPDSVVSGANVRPRGGDVQVGDVVARAGTRLSAAQIGGLAAAGLPAVPAARRPLASVLSTGTELRTPGEQLGPGEVYEANGVMLAAQLVSAGTDATVLPAVEDDEDAHRRALERALEADVVVTSGGVSVGPHDLVRAIEAELGVREVFWGVAVKPGKPLSFGVRDKTLVFGLPGNPVSSLVGFELFVRPAVAALQGAVEPRPRFETGTLTAAVRRNADRDQFLRGNREPGGDGLPRITPLSGQESHMIARAASADVLLHVPRGEGELAAGTDVRFLVLS